MAQQVLGAVGAVIGGIYGGWAGAQWGWAIGSTIGALADPTVTKGPSIGDIAKQTSQEGIPRPIVFALSQPISGNIIATGEPRIVRRRKSQGKGGPKVETESVYRTYAIRVSEGPITRFVRVWRNGTLVYDVSDDALINFADNAWFQRNARFFLGGWDQMPSPDLESIFGIGTTPAHRGTAYMVMADEDLTDLRGSIPQYSFQVERCEGYFLTSRPYPLESVDALSSTGTVPRDMPSTSMLSEGLESMGSISSGTLLTLMHVYDDALSEALDSTGSIEDGTLLTLMVTYDDAVPEALDSTGSMGDGILNDALIVYDEFPVEALDSTGTIESGSLV